MVFVRACQAILGLVLCRLQCISNCDRNSLDYRGCSRNMHMHIFFFKRYKIGSNSRFDSQRRRPLTLKLCDDIGFNNELLLSTECYEK
jgi:hypothetical protein